MAAFAPTTTTLSSSPSATRGTPGSRALPTRNRPTSSVVSTQRGTRARPEPGTSADVPSWTIAAATSSRTARTRTRVSRAAPVATDTARAATATTSTSTTPVSLACRPTSDGEASPVFETVLVANRGEIARRVIRTVQRMGLRAVAVHSEADAELPYVARGRRRCACIGPAARPRVLSGRRRGAGGRRASPAPRRSTRGTASSRRTRRFARRGASTPGWSGSARRRRRSRRWATRSTRRNLMAAAGVPVAARHPRAGRRCRGRPSPRPPRSAYPVMVKASAGGGGMGMARRHRRGRAAHGVRAGRAARRADRSATRPCSLERYFARARHVEVQVLGLADGRVVALGERDCSVQRRNQKVAEETPSPGGDSRAARRGCSAAAVRAGEAVGYRNAGTVECLRRTSTAASSSSWR